MDDVLDAHHFVGMCVLEPHRTGELITLVAGTGRETLVIHGLKHKLNYLRDHHCRKVITDIIDALETR